MRPLVLPSHSHSFSTLFSLASSAFRIVLFIVLFTSFAQPARAANQTVSPTDSRLVFDGQWRSQGQGAWQFTADQTASVTFTFTGSAIYYLSSEDPNGSLSAISIDGGGTSTVDQSAGQVQGGSQVRDVVLFSQTGLDGLEEHTIRVSWGGKGSLGGIYLAFFGFIYDDSPGNVPTLNTASPPANTLTGTPTPPTATSTTSPPSPTSNPNSSSSSSSSSPSSSKATAPSPTTSPSSTAIVSVGSAASKISGGSTEFLTSGGSTITQVLATSVGISDGRPVTVTATEVIGSDLPSSTSSSSTSTVTIKQNSTPMIGALAGGVLLVVLICLVLFFLIRRWRRQRRALAGFSDMEEKRNAADDVYAENTRLRDAAQNPPMASTLVAEASNSTSETHGSVMTGHSSCDVLPLRLVNPEEGTSSPIAPFPSASKAIAVARAQILSQGSRGAEGQGAKVEGERRARALAGQSSLSDTESDIASSSSPTEVGDRPISSAWMSEVAPPQYTERPS